MYVPDVVRSSRPKILSEPYLAAAFPSVIHLPFSGETNSSSQAQCISINQILAPGVDLTIPALATDRTVLFAGIQDINSDTVPFSKVEVNQ